MSSEQVGIYLPCYDIFRNKLEEYAAQNAPSLMSYTPLLAGSLARSLACTSCYPIELAKTRMQVFSSSLIEALSIPQCFRAGRNKNLETCLSFLCHSSTSETCFYNVCC